MTGQEIRRIRRELNKTQEEFAKIIGVSKNSVQLWETEKRNPSLTTVKLIKETYSKYSQTSNSNQDGINLVKDGVAVNLREVALFVADNIEELKKERFSTMLL
ncbi:helix-turn-helix domain-containing protein [Aquimarina agarivorans]|uniref:helix-turn-helix domain-containing protein n=1 Tax=Aquimarina agarivorans TaxID=980584 RepID=UPI0002EFD4DF|nr:helix-turn-helix domain-containing protein [Aquimarina agarivorans]